jgi:hypothetical protein
VAPPSWVAQRSGPNTQPFRRSAKRISETPPPVVASWARGAGMPTQWAPLSVVRTIEVQGADEQGAVPRTQPAVTDTKVADCASNPAGTGPPAGPGVTSPGVEADGDEVAGAVVGAAVVDDWLLAARWWPPPQPAAEPTNSDTAVSMKLTLATRVLCITLQDAESHRPVDLTCPAWS